MSKLELQSRSGDVIHQTLEMAKKDGHSCVSKIWYDKTISLDDGLEKVANAKRKRNDILTEFRHMRVEVDPAGLLCVRNTPTDKRYYPTDYAWGKICHWHNMPTNAVRNFTTDIENEKKPELTIRRNKIDSEIAQLWFDRQRKSVDSDKKFLFRTYQDGTLRTMVSERYAIIDNEWYLGTLKDLFSAMGKTDEPRLSHWRGDEDTIYGNLLIPDTVREEDDSDYGGMISMGNCEIGKRVLSQYPSIFRAICMNGCIWDQNKGFQIRKKHMGEIDYSDLRDRIMTNIHKQIPLVKEGIDTFLSMKTRKVEKVSMNRILAIVAKTYGIGLGAKGQIHGVADEYVKHESEYKNLFGIANAITRAGQALDNEEWVRFDGIAGSLAALPSSKWEAMQARARNLTADDLEEVYGFVP